MLGTPYGGFSVDDDLGSENAIEAFGEGVFDGGCFFGGEEGGAVCEEVAEVGHDSDHGTIVIGDMEAVAGIVRALWPAAGGVLAFEKEGEAAVNGVFDV